MMRRCRALLFSVVFGTVTSVASAQAADPVQAAWQAHLDAQQRLQSSAEADPTVPSGEVHVEVMDPGGLPIANQQIVLGVMDREGKRTQLTGKTDAKGTYRFIKLSADGSRSYRPKVLWKGATFATSPFQLTPEQGYRVRIVRLAVSSDERPILQHGQFIMDLRDERLDIVQHVRLQNLGTEAYAFPKDGKFIPLPEGFASFRSETGMTDIRIVEADGGFRVYGSLLPGGTMLNWGYHLPIDDESERIRLPLPWNTYRYQVVIPAIEGLSLNVEGLPETVEFEHEGQKMLGTELRRNPQDAPLNSLDIIVSGIPGPSPLRWIALGLAVLLALGLALLLGRGRSRSVAQTQANLATYKQSLLHEIELLHSQYKQGEIGPKFYETEQRRIELELARVLRMENTITVDTNAAAAT